MHLSRNTISLSRLISRALSLALLWGCNKPKISVPLPTSKSTQVLQTVLPAFEEVSEKSGIQYEWTIPGKRPLTILQTIGNGCAFLDYNNDGNLDILLVGQNLALYKGDGHGHFADVTKETGLDKFHGAYLGCAVGGYDIDDIYISGFGTGLLLHNEGGKRFMDVAQGAGLKSQPWGSSCTFVDIDGDGRLDLYIANYLKFGPKIEPQLCNMHGVMTSCGPLQYESEYGVLYHNLGHGRFEDVTKAWGFDKVHGKALGVAAAPWGKEQALAIANDQVPSDLMFRKSGKTENIGAQSGMSLTSSGTIYGGMGIDLGDYNNDGLLDIAIATYQNQAKGIYQNAGGVFAMQDTVQLGMSSSIPLLAFGVKWIDFDNDGWLDLLFSNGHTQNNIADTEIMSPQGPGAQYRQPSVLYHNLGGAKFEDQSVRLMGKASTTIVGRGLAIGDFDNDGKMDALIVDSEGKPLLLHNVTPTKNHWIALQLVGTHCNRNGYGAIVTCTVDGRKLVRHCHADGSYLSSSDKRVHFGLGASSKVTRLEILWSDGRKQLIQNLKVDAVNRVAEK